MANFLLVHGGWCLGWVWTDTAAALQEDGHSVTTVDLPSCGTEAAELGDWQADLAAIRLPAGEEFAQDYPQARRAGTEQIVGRTTVHYRCTPKTDPNGARGPAQIWLDQATGLLMKDDESHIQSVDFNAPVDADTFSTQPPPGAKVTVVP
jgi:hypothetical protein